VANASGQSWCINGISRAFGGRIETDSKITSKILQGRGSNRTE
jgi:hypothetical protein